MGYVKVGALPSKTVLGPKGGTSKGFSVSPLVPKKPIIAPKKPKFLTAPGQRTSIVDAVKKTITAMLPPKMLTAPGPLPSYAPSSNGGGGGGGGGGGSDTDPETTTDLDQVDSGDEVNNPTVKSSFSGKKLLIYLAAGGALYYLVLRKK